MTPQYDLAVVGAGPGGYVAAIRAAQLGKKVIVVDDEGRPGGTCLNWGCIPSKSLLRTAERFEFLKNAGRYGFSASDVGYDMKKIIGRSRDVVAKLNSGIEFLFKKNKIDYRVGRAKILNAGRLAVKDDIFTAGKILIAVGAKPRLLPDVQPDGRRVLTSKDALLVEQAPASLLIIGAGAIGMEFAYFFHALGSQVTVIELLDRILPMEDPEISDRLRKIYERQGMTIQTGARVENLCVEQSGVRVNLEVSGAKSAVSAETALIAIGVVPNTAGLFAEGIKLREEKGWIAVDDNFQTSLPGLYAIGDIIGPPWLAHVASHEGVIAVERMFTHEKPEINYDAIPACTYCQPQVASVGLTEAAARKKFGEAVEIGRFPFQALGKALATDAAEGFVKLVFAGPHAQIVGAHILGHDATEIIAELALAVAMEATRADILSTIHAHPTMAEAILEAALASADRAIHI